MSEMIYPLEAVRTLALHAQGLAASNSREHTPVWEDIQGVVEQLGCVQIDTLQMVRRSHYLVLWSRLGNHDPADFDRLIYQAGQRRLFEGWQHAASIIPLSEYRYQLPHMHHPHVNPADISVKSWLNEDGSRELIRFVKERIRQEGGLRASDFEYDGPRRGSWWDWKPAKKALEQLFSWGEVMVSARMNFQRVYDLTERVLPEWVDISEPTLEERNLHWLEQGLRVLGVCRPEQVGEYAYLKRGKSRQLLERLAKDKIAVPVKAVLADDQVGSLVVHRDFIADLEKAAQGEIKAERTTFLSPFDNLFWAKGRDRDFWRFQNALEAYKPAPTRIWGYFCLSILHRGRLVGRFDPKLERSKGNLRLKAIYLESGVTLEEDFIACLAAAFRDFMDFHGAKDLIIEKSWPEELARKLSNAL
jgi:uncharacterized protein YcaQ